MLCGVYAICIYQTNKCVRFGYAFSKGHSCGSTNQSNNIFQVKNYADFLKVSLVNELECVSSFFCCCWNMPGHESGRVVSAVCLRSFC